MTKSNLRKLKEDDWLCRKDSETCHHYFKIDKVYKSGVKIYECIKGIYCNFTEESFVTYDELLKPEWQIL